MHPLEKWRRKHKLSLRAAAARAGIGHETWRKVEQGICVPTLMISIKLHRETGVPLLEFIPEKDRAELCA